MLKTTLFLCALLTTSSAWSANGEQVSSRPPIVIASNVPPDIVNQLRNDINVINSFRGANASPIHKSIFGRLHGDDYMKWFYSRISTIGYDPTVASTSFPAIGYNDSSFGNQNNMMFTDYFVKGDLPQIARIVVLFHEARHSESKENFWSHINCPKPFKDDRENEVTSIFSGLPIAGLPGCDNTHRGAYGASATMMLNISHFCTSCTDKMKADAELYGTDQLSRLIQKQDRQKILFDIDSTAGNAKAVIGPSTNGVGSHATSK